VVEWSREQRVVLACARYPMDAGAIQDVCQGMEWGLDWERFFETAQALNVVALVTENLFCHLQDEMPALVADRIRQLRYARIARFVWMERQLEEIEGWFQAEGIPMLLFKGLPLAVLLYGSPLLRHLGDIDLMVRREDVKRVWRMLTEHSFRPSYELDERQQEALLRLGFAHDFNPGDKRPLLVCIGGRVYRTFSREDHLLFLCYHPVKHCYGDLRMICDIAAALRSAERLDWDYIGRHARRRGHARIVWTGIKLAQELLDAPVPEEVRREMERCPAVAELARAISARLFEGTDGWLRESQTAWGARMLVGGWWKTRYLLSKVFAPNEEDFAWLSLPGPLSFAYYGIRFIRLPWRYAGIIKRLKGLSKKPIKKMIAEQAGQEYRPANNRRS
jgi:hypothetical protein